MELPPLTRIQGVHAGSSLYHMNDGFFFSCCRQNGNSFNFRCSKWGSGCRATAVLRSGYFQSSVVHNHPPDPLRVPRQLERQRLINEAANLQYATFADIFSNTRNLFPDILDPHSLQPAMARMRSRALPEKPTSLRDLNNILSDERYKCLCATSGFGDSIYAGSTISEDDCLVVLLLSRECKQFMKLSTVLFSFTTLFALQGAPHQYVIHVIFTQWDNTIIVLAWFLLERISGQSFRAAFSYLKSLLVRSNFMTIVCKPGSIEASAYRAVFETVNVTYSLHAFVQSVGDFILSDIPNHPPDLIEIACWLCSLSIFPVDFAQSGWDCIQQEIGGIEGLAEQANLLLEHVRSQWFSVRSDFSVCGDHYRSSNINETIERKVLRIVDTHRNNIYSLIRGIVRSAEVSHKDIQELKCGRKIRNRRVVVSVASAPEIAVLTQALINPFRSPLMAARNLLNATSLRIKHILLIRLGLM